MTAAAKISRVRTRRLPRLDAARAGGSNLLNPLIVTALEMLVEAAARAPQMAPQRSFGAVCSAIHRHMDICFRVLNDNIGQAVQAKLEVAMPVHAAPGTADIRQVRGDPHHPVLKTIQGKLQPLLHMGAQIFGQHEAMGVDYDLHPLLPRLRYRKPTGPF